MEQNNNEPLVSICCITYNHAPFIRQCLDGFLMQRTNFPLEIIVHDDASTDGTADIIREYQEKYPEIIKPILQKENQYSKGIEVTSFNSERARGRYIALCEGDDYWCDPEKLQIQFDYMEKHPEISACYHSTGVIKGENPEFVSVIKCIDRDYDTWPITVQTSSAFFRNYDGIVDLFRKNQKIIVAGDVLFSAFLFQHGNFHTFSRLMSVYRQHGGGVTNSLEWKKSDWIPEWLLILDIAPRTTQYAKTVLLNFIIKNAFLKR